MDFSSSKYYAIYSFSKRNGVLDSSPNIVRVIKLRRLRWTGHVARMGGEVFTGFWLGGPKVRDHWGDRDRWGELDSGGSG
jgi:hypothetical protein